jgi:hypothetical protein
VKILQSAFCSLHFALLVASLYKYGINLWIFLASLADTIPACRSRLFRFLPLPERRWPLKPLARLIFPVAVTLNLFTAPLLLFIFGTCLSFQIGNSRKATGISFWVFLLPVASCLTPIAFFILASAA